MTAPRVLVAYASRHGSTAEIAAIIAETLRRVGLRVDLDTVDRIAAVDRYDAVILASAVYHGRWLKEADEFGRRFETDLAHRSVWLLSSGPLDHSTAEQDLPAPTQVARLAERIGARSHAWFGGALKPDASGFMERWMIRRGAAGDYRDLAAVRRWASQVGARVIAASEPLAMAGR